MPSAFSIPPILCSRPGVPGMAHGLASDCGSRWDGKNGSAPALAPGVWLGLADENSDRRPGSSSGCAARRAPDPGAALTRLISSSAWKVRIPTRLYLDNSCRMSEAGVIGYDPRNICRPASLAAVTRPFASAVLPVMLRYWPGGRVAGLISYWTENSSVVSP